MKKVLLMLFLVLVLVLAGCGKDDAEDKKGTSNESGQTAYKLNPIEDVELRYEGFGDINERSAMSVRVFNRTDKRILCSTWFVIEKQENGSWKELPVKKEPAFSEEDVNTIPEQINTEVVYKWKEIYGELSSGHYRIVLQITFKDEDDGIKHYMAAEFDVK